MKNKKCLVAIIAAAMSFAFTSCGTSATSSSASNSANASSSSADATTLSIANGTYYVYGYEWGPAVTKMVVKLNGAVSNVSKDDFMVQAGSATVSDGKQDKVTLTAAYTCDENGNKTDSSSASIAFEMTAVHKIASPFASDPNTLINSWNQYRIIVTLNHDLKVGGTVASSGTTAAYTFSASERKVPEFDNWEKGSYTDAAKSQTLTTIAYTPEKAKTDSSKNPLIVWLHGAGGGGTDPLITVLDTQCINLAKSPIQDYFTTDTQKGAYVLAVQTPTFWCNDGNGNYNSSLPANATEAMAGKGQPGLYTEALYKTIENYVANNPDIDTSRIYLGGCSNGGYMTIEMMVNYNNCFAAYFPSSEGYRNFNISDDAINKIKDSNVYFVQAEGDELFAPMEFTVPTYYRLIEAGATNVHFHFMEAGTLYAKGYIQHYSWIDIFNNEVKWDFDAAAVKADYAHLDFSDFGALTGQTTYVSHDNNTVGVEGGLWGWMSRQSLAA